MNAAFGKRGKTERGLSFMNGERTDENVGARSVAQMNGVEKTIRPVRADTTLVNPAGVLSSKIITWRIRRHAAMHWRTSVLKKHAISVGVDATRLFCNEK